MTKYIVKIVSFFLMPLLCLSLCLYFAGVRQVNFDTSFYTLFKSLSVQTLNVQIPFIPLIPSPEITNGFLAFVNFIVQVLNFVVNILNVFVSLMNVLIRVLMFIFNFLRSIFYWVAKLTPPTP